MFIDKELQFADGTWAPTAQGVNVSPNVLNQAPLGYSLNATANSTRDIGQGDDLYLAITVKTAVTSAGSATVTFSFRSATAANGTTGAVDHVSSAAIAKATLVAGYQVFLKLPAADYAQYLCVNANIGTADLTAGAFEAELVLNPQRNKKYASAFTLDA